jgi:kynureninase
MDDSGGRMTDFAKTRDLFHIPDGIVYLDGNSLGPLPRAVSAAVERRIAEEWGKLLIGGWNAAGWMEEPVRTGDRIGRLIGAEPGSVAVGDTLSIRIYQALAAALDLVPERRVVLSDSGNFPTDLYMAEGLIGSLGRGHELKIVAPDAVDDAIDGNVAVLLLTEVDYRTGRLHDMRALTAKAHKMGAVTVWDLAHSAGAISVDVAGAGADFAAGCTYKYLNAGPGAPAFIYVAPRHAQHARPALPGWLGHEAPFAFDRDYRAGQGIERMRIGTPPVIAMAALNAALDVWDGVAIEDVRAESVCLTNLFIEIVTRDCPELRLASPREAGQRGSQVSFSHPAGYAIVQALIARGVIGDFRAPDLLRFGFSPLYLDTNDVRRAAGLLAEIMRGRAFDRPEFRQVARVT